MTSPDRSGSRPVRRSGAVVVVVVVVACFWQLLLAPPGSAAGFCCPGTGCCRKACGGRSGRASLGSLSERLGMGRAGSRTASPLRNTHTSLKRSFPGLQRRFLENFEHREDLTGHSHVNHERGGETSKHTDKQKPRNTAAFKLALHIIPSS